MAYIRLNMAEMVVSKENDILAIHGLGSCIGLVLFEPKSGIGAMAHVMLPCNISKNPNTKPGKYVDTAIDEMLSGLIHHGIDPKNLVAKICGGASMFKTSKDSNLCIGEKNIELAEKILKEKHIPIKAKDVGGDYGRTIEFDVNTGNIRISTVLAGTKYI
jgi:chemotaxis protein CheD